MALFSKSKDENPSGPDLCAQCGTRDGTAQLHYTVPHGAADTKPHATWLCPACQEAIRRGAAGN
jgi:hypothetical protein